MNDLISRKALCEYALNQKDKSITPNEIMRFPSAEPQWILVSERLPEEHEWFGTEKFGTTISDEVFVTFESPTGERFCKHLCFQNGKISRYDQSSINVWHKDAIPIAWKPFPKPYEGDKE